MSVPHAVSASVPELRQDIRRYSSVLMADLYGFFSEYDLEEQPESYLRMSVEANLHTILFVLDSGISGRQIAPPAAARAWARHMSYQDLAEDVIKRIYYVGFSMIWENWVAPEIFASSTSIEAFSEANAYGHTQLFAYLDNASLVVAREFRNERENCSRVGELSADSWIKSFIAGQDVDARELEGLGYPCNSPQNCLIWWPNQDDDTNRVSRIQTAVESCAVLARVIILLSAHDDVEIMAWVTGEAHELAVFRDTIVTRLSEPDLAGHLMLGIGGSGVAGMRTAYDQARKGQSLALRAASRKTVTVFGDEEKIAHLLTADPREAKLLAEDVLGPLNSRDPEMNELRETLSVFLRNGLSYQATARDLFLHRNTVLYRIQKAERLLKRSVVSNSFVLSNALLISKWV